MEEDIINEFKNIVEESRTEDRTDYYIKLRNTLDLIENLINKYKEYEECLEVTSLALNNIAYDQIPIAIEDLKLSSIPKSKAREMIKELENRKKELQGIECNSEAIEILEIRINDLQILLEE